MSKIDEELKMKFANDKQRFIANLVFTTNWFKNRVFEFLKPYNLSIQQLNILRILIGAKKRERDWVTMQEIKELMVEKAPNATRLSDKLLDKGLVARKRSEEDRRVVYLGITDKGLDLVHKIDEDENKEYLSFMNKISGEEAKFCSDIFDKMRE